MKHILVLLLAIGCSQVEEAEKQETQTEAKNDVRELNVAKATPEEKAAIERYKRKAKQEKLDKAKQRTAEAEYFSPEAKQERRRKKAQVREAIGIELSKKCHSEVVFEKFASTWIMYLPGVGSINRREVMSREQRDNMNAVLDRMTNYQAATGTKVTAADFFRYAGNVIKTILGTQGYNSPFKGIQVSGISPTKPINPLPPPPLPCVFSRRISLPKLLYFHAFA